VKIEEKEIERIYSRKLVYLKVVPVTLMEFASREVKRRVGY
jgi:hypothetical protein